MAEDRRLLSELAAADQALRRERLRPEGVQRIANRISRELDRQHWRRRFGWIPMLTFVAGAALVLLFLSWSREQAAAPEPDTVAQGQVSISGPDCEQQRVDNRVALEGACEVVSHEPSMRIQTVEAAALKLEGRVVEIEAGTALFDVDPVVGDPVRVRTPAGEIVVVGTRFRVVVSGDAGQVDLYEGKLEFHANDGSVAPIAAGQQFAFGKKASPKSIVVAPEPAATIAPSPVAPPKKAKRPKVPPKPGPVVGEAKRDASQVIAAVQNHRRHGEYKLAAARLQEALGRNWPPRTADVLSYELGRILARHLRDVPRACTHWREHLKRFSSTRYRRQIEASQQKLSCDPG